MAASSILLTVVVLFVSAVTVPTTAKLPPSTFIVEGRVYCDNCRAGFETTISEYLSGARVKLDCQNETTHKVIQTIEAVTDSKGSYHIEISHDHEDETCEVSLVSSPKPDCSEIKSSRNSARVVLTENSGMASDTRNANSLGFLKKEPLKICKKLLKWYDLEGNRNQP
ncbi:Pollen Ole e 1 allergen and extensin family protein [Zostera marina]|uniref:Pollen Ole e 1 allergen and extensin family protein n=1 Tax=Zostera marina TaxID=29655 RepID=A0A0K9NK51_ZOSMR|nr:Pollen Ole e 1 allergen and extensin family protein [Zostera marina]